MALEIMYVHVKGKNGLNTRATKKLKQHKLWFLVATSTVVARTMKMCIGHSFILPKTFSTANMISRKYTAA